MPPLDQYSEFSLINRLTKGLAKHPGQVNARHGSDAELVTQPDGSILAATIDSLHEEYALGLIRDPFTVGWSVVAHSLSDLAAVAADPIGVLLALNFPREAPADWGEKFFAGAQEALQAHGTFCLGGDTNFCQEPTFTCAALGRIPAPPALQRTGAQPGDLLYATGLLGSGNLLGITSQVDKKSWEQFEKTYRPMARLKESRRLRTWMKCAIDTSDALLQALAILADLNGVGIIFEHRPELYDPRLVKIAGAIRFPLWLVNVFGMGEYELVFAVDRRREADFLADATKAGMPVFALGVATNNPGIRLRCEGREHALDVPYLLNLFGTCPNIQDYLKALVAYDQKLRGAP